MAASDRKLGAVLRALRDAMPNGYSQSIGKRLRGERKEPPAIVWIPQRSEFAQPNSTNAPRAIVNRRIVIDVEIYAGAGLMTATDDESNDFDTIDEALADVVRTIYATVPANALTWIGEEWDESHGAVEDGRLCTLTFAVDVPVTELPGTTATINAVTMTQRLQVEGAL